MNILSRQPKPKLKPKPKPTRCGFTLVELLFVIAIIAILSSLSLAMIRSAQREARYSATQSRLTHIQNILSIYIEDMEFRKLPFRVSALVVAPTSAGYYTRVQRLRSQLLVDYLNVELPNDKVVLGDFPSQECQKWLSPQGLGNFPLALGKLVNVSPPTNKYHTALIRRWKTAGPGINLPGERLFQLLYMVEFDGDSALASLGNGAIGDSDGDGNMEVVDSWGDPLKYRLSQQNPVTQQWEPLDLTQTCDLTDLRFDVWSDKMDWRKDL